MPNTAGSTAQISGLTEYASRCFLDMYCKRTLCIFQVIYLSMRLQRKYCNNNLKGNCYVSSGQTKTDVIRMRVVQHYECHTNFQITCIWWKIERCFLVLFNRINVIKSNCKGQVTGWNLAFWLQYLQFRRASVSV